MLSKPYKFRALWVYTIYGLVESTNTTSSSSSNYVRLKIDKGKLTFSDATPTFEKGSTSAYTHAHLCL